MAEVTVTAHCLCKAHTFCTSIPSSSLPLQATCCHCDSCRHATGGLYLSTTVWPNGDEDLSSLKTYSFSANITHYSCATCSTPLFCRGADAENPLEVLTGALINVPNLVKYTKHIFVGDTRDGGASIWFAKDVDDSKPIPRWAGFSERSEELPPSWPGALLGVLSAESGPGQHSAETKPQAKKARPDETPLRCHCGGVNFILRSAVDLARKDTGSLPWYVDPVSLRYLASTEVCDWCRLQLGVDLAYWTFAGLDHISFPVASSSDEKGAFPGTVAELKSAVTASDKDARLGMLGVYHSSADVDRYFCTRCSAVVFYAVDDEGRTDMVDIAVGLLRHPDGARAEGLLSWNYGVVGWAEDVVGGWREGLVRAAGEQSEEWRVRHGVDKCWRRVKKEEAEAQSG